MRAELPEARGLLVQLMPVEALAAAPLQAIHNQPVRLPVGRQGGKHIERAFE